MKKETNLIWELIEESFKEEETSLYTKYVEYFNSMINPILESNLKTIKEYLITVYGIKKYYKAEENYFAYKLLNEESGNIIKKENYDSILNDMVLLEIEKKKWKLKCSVFSTLAGVNIVSCKKIHFSRYVKGFEGTWSFTTAENETAVFETKAIFANGPIKIEHYRYVSHIIGNTNIQSDSRLRNEILKKLKEENPDLKKKLTPEEKEFKKRLEKAEAEVKWAKYYYDNCVSSIERNKKDLLTVDTQPLLGIEENLREQYRNELKEDYTKDLNFNEINLPKLLKKLQKVENELALVKGTDLIQVNKELTEKNDKKRIKELKDKLSSNRKRSDAEQLQEELNTLYVKYPEIKAKEIRSQIRNYEDMLKYAKAALNWENNKPEFIEQKKKDIEEFTQKIIELKAV